MPPVTTERSLLGRPLPQRTSAFLQGSRERVRAGIASPKHDNWTRAFFDMYREEPLARRQALSFAYALRNEPVVLLDGAMLVGQIYQAVEGSGSPDMGGAALDPRWNEFDAQKTHVDRIRQEIPELVAVEGDERSWISPIGCAPGHVGWRWDWIVKDGATGLLERIDGAWEKADERGRAVLEGMRISLEALLEWSDLHVEALERKLETAAGKGKAALQRQVDACKRVPRFGARDFREALQSFHISYTATLFENPHGGNGPGRLDYHLWPYLERDLAAARETLESARELIDELFIRFHERLMHENDGWVEAIVVAGSDAQGASAANPLSTIMVESIAGLGITHPSVYIRLSERPPESLLDLAARDLAEGGNRAQILSDPAIVRALTRRGIPEEDARMYMCGGCMEVSPQGMNGDLLFTSFFNTGKVLELALTGGVCLNTGRRQSTHLKKSLADYVSFEELYAAFARELDRILTLTFRRIDIAAEKFARLRPRFLLSSQVADCIERGRVINDGGARYEDRGVTPLGLPNLGDALFAVKRAVFEEKFVTGSELLAALKANLQGCEPLRRRLAALPKYGQGRPEADAMVNRVVGTVCDVFDSFTNRLGGRIKPVIMTFVLAPVAGAALGAAPDGRRAGAPIAQGLAPQSSSMTEGITAAILSATSLDWTRFSGGATSMWDLDSHFATVENIKSLLQAFLNRGGQIYHGNTTDAEELRQALEDPERHAHLMVRVGGYSARFVTLSPELQREIIGRYRHSR